MSCLFRVKKTLKLYITRYPNIFLFIIWDLISIFFIIQMTWLIKGWLSLFFFTQFMVQFSYLCLQISSIVYEEKYIKHTWYFGIPYHWEIYNKSISWHNIQSTNVSCCWCWLDDGINSFMTKFPKQKKYWKLDLYQVILYFKMQPMDSAI